MSNTEKTMVILWIAISFILSASGQTNYIFRNINIQHGLPDNQIKGLFLSPDGRIGIRTAALLALIMVVVFLSFLSHTSRPSMTGTMTIFTKNMLILIIISG